MADSIERCVRDMREAARVEGPTGMRDTLLTVAGRLEAAAMAATVPAGWKLVPEESTPEMEEAGFNHVYAPTTTDDCAYVWSAMLKAAPQAPVAGQPAEPSPADMLDWLDETNKRFKMGWEVGAAPAGNVSVRTIIMGGKPIREAIRAAMPAPKGDSNG